MTERPRLPEGVRLKRVERLLYELQYEIVTGLFEDDFPEQYEFTFYGPPSKSATNAMMFGRFVLKPVREHFLEAPDEHD